MLTGARRSRKLGFRSLAQFGSTFEKARSSMKFATGSQGALSLIRLRERPQHPVGHRPKTAPVLLQTFGKPRLLVHPTRSLATCDR
jgi:hypothetical protein